MNIRTQFPDLFLASMLPALDSIIFNKFDRFPPQYTKVFRVMKSGRSIEQTSEIAGLGLFNELGENEGVRYDESVPGFNKTYIHSQYGLGFRISRVMVDDDRFGIISKMSEELGDSARETIEIAAASIFNNGFSGSFPGPDGKALFATDHPLVKTGGTQTNTLAAAADLDVASLELALTDFRRMKNPSGKKIKVRPKKLIVAPEGEWVASELLSGSMRSDTSNHTVNAFKHRIGMGSFDEAMVWEYLTDPDAWFLMTDQADHEVRFYWREKPNTVHAIDFETRAVKTAMWYRHSMGWSNFYGVYGVPGV